MVTGSRVVRPDFSSSSPVVSVDQALLQDSSSSRANSCTILDPRRDLNACRSLVDAAAPGARGRANAQLSHGLALAWQGDLDRAIEAFGRAIRTAPDLSIAHLNRGLAYRAKGDLRRALSDLNRAVESDPGSARTYYHRSLLHRASGDAARADADAAQATALDPGYQGLLQR